MFFNQILVLAPLILAVSAQWRCGTRSYTEAQTTQAANASCSLLRESKTVGNNDYPHQFNNREGLIFIESGPWYEFPVRTDGVFDGNKGPGADRVVTTRECKLAGVITHDGASSQNGFVPCQKSNSGAASSTNSTTASNTGTSTATRTSGAAASTTSKSAVGRVESGMLQAVLGFSIALYSFVSAFI